MSYPDGLHTVKPEQSCRQTAGIRVESSAVQLGHGPPVNFLSTSYCERGGPYRPWQKHLVISRSVGVLQSFSSTAVSNHSHMYSLEAFYTEEKDSLTCGWCAIVDGGQCRNVGVSFAVSGVGNASLPPSRCLTGALRVLLENLSTSSVVCCPKGALDYAATQDVCRGGLHGRSAGSSKQGSYSWGLAGQRTRLQRKAHSLISIDSSMAIKVEISIARAYSLFTCDSMLFSESSPIFTASGTRWHE